MSEYILEMRGITKEFPGIKALDGVNLKVRRGEIHALVGENGAGKSTLMNVLSGVYPYGSYTGDIVFEDQVCEFHNIPQSEAAGIAIIHQELALIPLLSIAENLFLGNERKKNGLIDWRETYRQAAQQLARVGLHDNPNTLITNLGVGKQQLVEIAKALSKKCKLLILDEPTASLNDTDSENLLELLKQLRQEGMTCILISHKLGEVVSVADAITIIRDGRTVDHFGDMAEVTEERIIRGMVGRELTDRFPRRCAEIGEVRFEVKNWNVYHPLHGDRQVLKDVSIQIRRGEVVGLAGLMGAGRTELAMSVFGGSYGRNISGEVWLDGKRIDTSTVSRAIRHGIAYVSEDRKTLGLIQMAAIASNISLTDLKRVSEHSIVNPYQEFVETRKAARDFGVKCSSLFQPVSSLSGGNQQKVVLAKWMYCESDILLLDEPTHGIDVGAKYEVYKIINDLAAQGHCILLISSELPEILGVCDRIYVMGEGMIKGEMMRDEATQERIMRLLV